MRRLDLVLGVLLAWSFCGCFWNPTRPSASDWKEVESPTTRTLWSMFFVNKDNGWAVGDSGTIVHYDGTSWNAFESPTTSDLRSVYFPSDADGWAVGYGVILHYDGTEWCEAYSDSYAEFYSVWFTTPASGWVVGRHLGPPEPYSFILHYDGTEWSEQNKWSGYSGLYSVRFLAGDDGWIGGSYVLLHFDAGEWRANSHPPGTVWCLHFTSSSDGWATSILPVPSDGDTVRSRILHYDGNDWEIAYESTSCLFSVWLLSSTQGWAGGSNIVYFNGNRWRIVKSEADVTSFFFLAEDEGWTVGWHGKILHYRGS